MKYTKEQYKSAIEKLHLQSKFNTKGDKAFFNCCYHSGDKTPSLSINFKLGVFHCFGCGISGSIPWLIKERTGKTIEEFLSLGIDEFSKFSKSPKEENIFPIKNNLSDKEVDIRGVIIPWNVSKEATEYLKIRHINSLIATRMNMKYTEESYINGNLFKKRLLIPVYNENGLMINVEGRDITFKQERKCLYPSNTYKPVYEWYKLDRDKPIFLFEGLIKMAVARSDSYFENSTATFGNLISSRQIDILNKFKEIIIVPDNDKGGRQMIKFFIEHLNHRPKVLRIRDSEIKDADEIPLKSGKSVKEYRESGGFILESSLLLQ